MVIHLSNKKCIACEAGTAPLRDVEIAVFMPQVHQWEVGNDEKSISKQFQFKNFTEALAFVDKVGALAEEERHHPDISLFGYRNVRITLTTFAIGGLSENDFILAAKIDRL